MPGTFRAGKVRWPRSPASASNKAFGVNKKSALSVAAARFGFEVQGDLL